MTRLLEDPNSVAGALGAAMKTAKEEAQRRWAAFDAERQKAMGDGTDLSTDTVTLKKLDDLKASYDESERECEDLRERWERHVVSGHKGIPNATDPKYGKVSGIGAEFLRKLGAGVAGVKALDGTQGGSMVGPFFDERIRDLPQRQLFVRSLIPTATIDSDKVHYLRQSVATNNAAPVAAGELKPTSVFTVERIEESVVTVAHVTEALDRALLSDFDSLVDFLDGQLRLGVLLAEEDQILNGDGNPPNLTGILNTQFIGSQAKGADAHVDAIHKAINTCRLAFHEPDAIVLHPTDWQNIRLAKKADGEYLTAPVLDADPDRLWGKQVVTSPVMAAGTGLVGAFGTGAQVWDRDQARVTFTESGLGDAPGQELFSRNLVRFRGESRLAFGVLRPSAFTEVTGLS